MAKRKQAGGKFDRLLKAFGITVSRPLDLAAPMRADVSRIGYDEEGLRLTISLGSPYKFNAEVQLSRADATWLRDRLTQELNDPRNGNMPKGRASTAGDVDG